jgi:hypothetical protein
VVGAALIAFSTTVLAGAAVSIRAWLGMIGLVLVLHFGVFQFLSCLWRSAGVQALPLMRSPILAKSVAEFWGSRWNTAFRDFAHRFVFVPMSRRVGPHAAIVLTYLFSGIVHDLVITVPAEGGYGGPTAYFLLQAAGLFVERSRLGRSVGLGRGLVGRLFAVAVVVGPVTMLFPMSFVANVVLPFLAVMTATMHGVFGGLQQVSLSELIFAAGIGQLCILVASALVPFRLDGGKSSARCRDCTGKCIGSMAATSCFRLSRSD